LKLGDWLVVEPGNQLVVEPGNRLELSALLESGRPVNRRTRSQR